MLYRIVSNPFVCLILILGTLVSLELVMSNCLYNIRIQETV